MSIGTVEALYMADSHAQIDQQGARAKYSGAEAEIDSGRCEGVGGTNAPPPMTLRRPCRPPPPIRTKWERGRNGQVLNWTNCPESILRFFDHKTRWPGRYWGKTETETTISGFRSLIENETRKSWTKKSRPLKNATMHRYKAAWS